MQYTPIVTTKDKTDRYPTHRATPLKHNFKKCNAHAFKCECTCALCERYNNIGKR